MMPTAHLRESSSTSIMIMGKSHLWTQRRVRRKRIKNSFSYTQWWNFLNKLKKEWSLYKPLTPQSQEVKRSTSLLRTGVTKKYCEQWEDMPVGLKTCQDFKDHFAQAYMSCRIHKKAAAVAHGYGASENHTQETEARVNTADALKALACVVMEDKEAMANLTIINLTLSQSLTQAKETILMLSKKLQTLQVH